MAISDPDVISKIIALGDHFRNNINNRYIRKALMTMEFENSAWDLITNLTDENSYGRIHGFRYDELYERIYAMARFIGKVKSDVAPNLKNLISSGSGTFFSKGDMRNDANLVLQNIAVSNFKSNLSILADMLNELFMLAVELDKKQNGPKAVYLKMSELKDVGRLLV
jgi:hypothetical protein